MLLEALPERLQTIARLGRYPDEPKDGDDSRSAWVFDFTCGALRCGATDEDVADWLTDPTLGISEAVLDKGSRAVRYVYRQIREARKKLGDDPLDVLNAKHAVIRNLGGKCRVIEETFDPVLKRHVLSKQSFEDFRNGYMHETVFAGASEKGKPLFKPKGAWWLENPERRQYERLVFAPGVDVPGSYNLWRGFGCEAVAGDCSLFLAHVRDNVCGADEALYAYMVGWMARAVQMPAVPGEVAVVLRGGKGTGKSLFGREFGKLFGRHFLHISNASHLTGNFNAHFRDVVLLFADEAVVPGDKKQAAVLSSLITEHTIAVEAKGVDVEQAPNCVHVVMASNDSHVVPAGADERRYFVLDVADSRKQDIAYFRAIVAQMDGGGREALLHYLQTYNLDSFEVRRVPQTAGLRDQKGRSLDAGDEFVLGILLAGEVGAERPLHRGFSRNAFLGNGKATRPSGLYDVMRQREPRLRNASDHALGRILTRWGAAPKKSGDRYWEIPNLRDMRAEWVRRYGPREWPDDDLHWSDSLVRSSDEPPEVF